MVKYSKYLVSLVLVLCVHHGQAQTNTLERDKEICRITLENYLKQWDEALILNRIEDSEASYENNTLSFEIEAPNAQVILNVQKGQFKEGDAEVMSTFYNAEVIALQQERLLQATGDFVQAFNSYLPKLKPNEKIRFDFRVADKERKDKSGKVTKLKGAEDRSYTLSISWSMSDISSLASGEINENEFTGRATIKK